ncbi:hypothetical protein EDB84DRAFT_1441374 [Lactarius hengduanensis]|nr:hypothetical protein EDB84DRAFT_1441374 [Lactarius hengduanensis]
MPIFVLLNWCESARKSLDYDLSARSTDPLHTRQAVRHFLTAPSPAFPLGIPHALGLHIADAPLHEALTSQAELIKALTSEVRGLAAIVHARLPPPGVAAPAPPPLPRPSAQPPPKTPTTKPSAPPKVRTPVPGPPKPPAHAPSFASITKSPARPSLVLSPAPGSSSTAVRKTPSEICAHLNDVLAECSPGSSLSAARWTKNNNLVIVAGPDTTSQHLRKNSALLSKAVAYFIAVHPSHPVPVSAKENVRWSRLLINNIPTGVSPSRGAYSPLSVRTHSYATTPPTGPLV